MKTPPNLEGLIGALIAVEKACEGTNFEWLVRSDERGGYFANISNHADEFESFPSHASTPSAALANALIKFNLRNKRSKP